MITADQRRLVFEPLGDTAWRLFDTTVAERDASLLVTCIERVASGDYVAIWLGFGIRPSLHPTREDVLRTAQLLGRADALSTRSKPIPIPHPPPVWSGHPGWGVIP